MESVAVASPTISAPVWFYTIGSIASIIIIVGAIWGVIAWFSTVRNKVKQLDGFGEWKGAVDSERSAVIEFMREVRGELSSINKSFHDLLASMGPVLYKRASPLQLTEFGQEIVEDLKAEEIVERLAPIIMAKIGRGSQAFTINDICFDYITGDDFQPTDDEADRISETAYVHGLRRSQVREALAIVLRDGVLERMMQGESLEAD